jgi:hypothetical protein
MVDYNIAKDSPTGDYVLHPVTNTTTCNEHNLIRLEL